MLLRGEWTEADLAGTDWAAVLRIGRRQEVVALVHRSLERLGFPGVPPAIRETLTADRRTVAARNALLVRELVRVLGILDTARVPTIPMKGVTLSETLYGEPGLRDCSDIDVLVPRDRAREALHVLRAHGYAAEFSERFFETLLLRGHIEYTLKRRERGFEYVLDLHWGIGWTARTDRAASAALWNDTRRVTRLGIEMLAMSPEWELLTLAVHAARHGWQPLKWLVDVHDYCARGVLDWQRVRELAQRFEWLPALEQTLAACQVSLCTPAIPGVTASASAAWRNAVAGTSSKAVPAVLLPLRVIDRFPQRVAYLLRQLLVPTLAERRLVRLPSAMGTVYYPLRPLRLGARWAWRFVRYGARRIERHLRSVLGYYPVRP